MARPETTHWYRTNALPPPLGVRVRVMWDGRMFEASRVLHPQHKRECWMTFDRNLGAVFLPLATGLRRGRDQSSPWQGWHDLDGHEPQYYQPLYPERWAVPLPEPVTVSRRFPAAPGGGPARIGHNNPPPDHPVADPDAASAQWWRDPLAIAYEPEGGVSLRMTEGRLMRAVAFCGAGGGAHLLAPGRSPLSDVIDEIREDLARGEAIAAARFRPMPQDHDDFEIAMRWFMQLNPPETWSRHRKAWALNRRQKVPLRRARSVPLSFGEIGYEFGVSGERARQVYVKSIDDCWRFANGRRVDGLPTPAERMAALRERNRKSRREAGS